MRNRLARAEATQEALPVPVHMAIDRSMARSADDGDSEELLRLTKALDDVRPDNDFVIIDTPGSDSFLSRMAHSYADTLVTPRAEAFG
jgi:chromosome partitioning protein